MREYWSKTTGRRWSHIGSRDAKTRSRDRGQSELVGFLLIFSVGILLIALTITTGFVGLDSAQDFQRTTNAERGFTALADDVSDVVYHGASRRTTEIRLADAKLSIAETESIAVVDENGTTIARVETSPIEYDSGTGTTITYENGALIRQDEGHPVMFREPDFVLTDEELRLPLLGTTAEDGRAVGGDTSVEIETRRTATESLVSDVPASNVTLQISTQYVDAWVRYFEQFEDDLVAKIDEHEDGVNVTIVTDRVYVIDYDIAVSFR